MCRSNEFKGTVRYANPTFAWASYLQEMGRSLFKWFRIVLHTFDSNLNQIELIHLGFWWAGQINPIASESIQIHHSCGNPICKKSKACFSNFLKLCFTTFDANQKQIKLMRPGLQFARLTPEFKCTVKYENQTFARASYWLEIGSVHFKMF